MVGTSADENAVMNRGLILTLYLGDQVISALLPFSSGPFTIALLLICLQRMHVTLRTQVRVASALAAALAAGTVGALLSATPLGAFFVATAVLLALMWMAGASLSPKDMVLITPRGAFIGVMVASAFLVLGLLGLDAMSIARQIPANRVAGLFLEPSQYALFVMPLWLIAVRRPPYRPWLYAALALPLATAFSTTLVIVSGTALAIHLFLEARRTRLHFATWARRIGLSAIFVMIAGPLSSQLSVDDVPLNDYVKSRFIGLLDASDEENYNISSLVVLQGLELASLSFTNSFGFGVGLGNFGTSERVLNQSSVRAVITSITTDNIDLSLRDGGLLASKLFGELGLLSLPLVALMVRYFRRLRLAGRGASTAYHSAFAAVMLCMLFTRALPYFAAPVCLGIFSIAGVTQSTRKTGGARRDDHRRSLPPSRRSEFEVNHPSIGGTPT
jgi:hypothetical protein